MSAKPRVRSAKFKDFYPNGPVVLLPRHGFDQPTTTFRVALLDVDDYAVTFRVSQLSLWITVCSICSLAPSSRNVGRLSVGLGDFGGTDDVLLFRTELARLGEVPGGRTARPTRAAWLLATWAAGTWTRSRTS